MGANGGARPGAGRPKGSMDGVQRMSLQARKMLVWYLMTGEEYCPLVQANVSAGIKERADELVKASKDGNVKATRDILDRVAGRATQTVDLSVSERKMIKDDTAKRLAPGAPPVHIDAKVVNQKDKSDNTA